MLFIAGDGIDDPVGTHFAGIVVVDWHAGLDARADHVGGVVKKITHNRFHDPGQGGHDRGDDGGFDRAEAKSGLGEETVQQDRVFIRSTGLVRGKAPVADERERVVDPQNDIAVADVDHQKHLRAPSHHHLEYVLPFRRRSARAARRRHRSPQTCPGRSPALLR